MGSNQSELKEETYRCKQFTRSASASIIISANTGIRTQSFGFPLSVVVVVEISLLLPLTFTTSGCSFIKLTVSFILELCGIPLAQAVRVSSKSTCVTHEEDVFVTSSAKFRAANDMYASLVFETCACMSTF